MVVKSLALATLLATSASALSVPSNIQTFYNNVKNGGCKSFAGGKSNLNDGQGHSGFGFCTDTANVIYLSGKNSLGDMDIDCDGASNCGGLSGDWQSGTSFDDILSSKGYGISTLDASVHQFSVLGTCNLDLTNYNLKPLSLVAVVCNNQLFYSVWGDTNGCDDNNFTGEASISLAQMCFPNEGLNGNKGHEAHDVLYLAFTGSDAVVGPSNANWKTTSASTFQSSLKAFGDSILAKKFGTTVPPTTTSNPTNPSSTSNPGTCSWAGHCAGAACSSSDDCDGDLECKSGICGGSTGGTTPPATCSWAGHCAGAACSSSDDCDGDLECKSGICGGSTGGTTPPATCSWAGHCAGASCSSADDCDGDLDCKSGKCSA